LSLGLLRHVPLDLFKLANAARLAQPPTG